MKDVAASEFTFIIQTNGLSSCTAGVVAPNQTVSLGFADGWCTNGCSSR